MQVLQVVRISGFSQKKHAQTPSSEDLERTQMLEIIQKYSQERRNAIQAASSIRDFSPCLGGSPGSFPKPKKYKRGTPKSSMDCPVKTKIFLGYQSFRKQVYIYIYIISTHSFQVVLCFYPNLIPSCSEVPSFYHIFHHIFPSCPECVQNRPMPFQNRHWRKLLDLFILTGTGDRSRISFFQSSGEGIST